MDQGDNDLLRLPGRGAIADRDQLHPVLFDHVPEDPLRFLHLVLRRRGVDHASIQDLTGLIHYRELAASTEGRVPAQDHLPRNGRLHQKLRQILAKDLDRAVFRIFCQIVPDFPLNRGEDQPAVAVRNGVAERGLRVRILFLDDLPPKDA